MKGGLSIVYHSTGLLEDLAYQARQRSDHMHMGSSSCVLIGGRL